MVFVLHQNCGETDIYLCSSLSHFIVESAEFLLVNQKVFDGDLKKKSSFVDFFCSEIWCRQSTYNFDFLVCSVFVVLFCEF